MKIYFEDVRVGSRHQSPAVRVTEAEILAFARAYDPQPMHVDREAAERGPFKGLIASGWHTAALVMRLVAEARPFGDTEVLGLGVEQLQWPHPVRPGDTIQSESEVVATRASKSNPAYGIVKITVTTRNQRGEVVMIHSPSCWVPRRPRDSN
ncbi:MAG TPA: MaoC family dehydratase [Bryobacteraceae bacterium]|nr:MaoC family dehydratase [Bryobacteraceae bacterium]